MNFIKYGTQVPSEYQEIEYLESNGTQYIDTNIIPTNSAQTKVQFEFQLTDITNGINQSIGCNSNMNFTSSQTLLKFRSNAIEIADFDTAWHICEISKSSSGKVTYFDGVEYSTSSASEEALSFILFGMSLSSNRYYGKYKLKYFKCYENNTLVRNMIPVRRVSDNVLGMYDIVNNMFYTNQGTDSLIAGSDVNNWTDTPHYIHNTSTDTITTLPAVVYANAATATVGLKGQTVQNATPTPDNPVVPNGTGERTGNLFDDFDIVGRVPSVNNGNLVNYNDGACTDLIELSSGLLTLSIYETMVVYVFLYDVNKSFLGWVNLSSAGTRTTQQITNYENAKYARVRTDNYSAYLNNKKIMLNSGSTALPYEKFGIKIPILNNSQTTNVYLGEVESTRKIKKLVLTGEEDWVQSVSGIWVYRINVPDYLREIVNIPICTHYKGIAPVTGTGDLQDLETAFLLSSSGNNYYYIRDDRFNNANDFKSYITAQYSAGTPVCVWYVLATEETAVVNEPLRKIGDYADTVSGITIPTIAGANTLSVDTTLQPSEVTATYKGWHPVADVHERENGAWT